MDLPRLRGGISFNLVGLEMFKINIDVYDTDETYLYHSCDDAQEALSYLMMPAELKRGLLLS